MNKDPELNYYALKLAISLKGDDGDTFTKVYDEICKSASLTDEQVCQQAYNMPHIRPRQLRLKFSQTKIRVSLDEFG